MVKAIVIIDGDYEDIPLEVVSADTTEDREEIVEQIENYIEDIIEDLEEDTELIVKIYFKDGDGEEDTAEFLLEYSAEDEEILSYEDLEEWSEC